MNWRTRISPWPSLHSNWLHLRNLRIPTTINFPSPHFTSLHFFMISTTPSLHLTYHVPNPLPKITWFTGESPQSIMWPQECPLYNNRCTKLVLLHIAFEPPLYVIRGAVPVCSTYLRGQCWHCSWRRLLLSCRFSWFYFFLNRRVFLLLTVL
jgi:hypothetical protein